MDKDKANIEVNRHENSLCTNCTAKMDDSCACYRAYPSDCVIDFLLIPELSVSFSLSFLRSFSPAFYFILCSVATSTLSPPSIHLPSLRQIRLQPTATSITCTGSLAIPNFHCLGPPDRSRSLEIKTFHLLPPNFLES